MSEVDASIPLQAKGIQLEDPMTLRAKGLQLRQLGLQTAGAQRDYDNQTKLADLYKQNIGADGSVNHQAIMAGMAQSGLGAQIPAYQKSLLDVTKTGADIGHVQAQTGEANANTQSKQLETTLKNVQNVGQHIYALSQTPGLTHDQAFSAINDWVNQGVIDPNQGAQIARNLPGDPVQLKAYMQQKAVEGQGIEQQIQTKLASMPKYEYKNTGGSQTPVDINPLTNPTPQPLRNTVAPDTAATISKDYAVAGLNPDGTPGTANDALVKMIGENRIVPSDRLESTPRGQAILSSVEAKYPGYDRSTAQAKVAAARDFTVGKDAAMLRSIGTATKHLDMLDGLVGALDNGNTPLFNKLANAVGAQTGSTAPGNFDAAKDIVGKEVIKGIVAGGGGVDERKEASTALSNAKTPAQLRGVIATYKAIMGAQHESLLQQRDAAGLPRSTLPDYTEGAGQSTVPPDIAAILAKHGGK